MISDEQREARRSDDDGARAAAGAQGVGPSRGDAHEGLPGVAAARGEGRAHAADARSCIPDMTRAGVGGDARARQVAVGERPRVARDARWSASFGAVRDGVRHRPGLRPLLDRVERHVVRELAGARDVRVADRAAASSSRCTRRWRTAACATSTSTASTGRWTAWTAPRVLRGEVRRPAVRRRHAGGLPLPGRAPPGDRARRERRSRSSRSSRSAARVDLRRRDGAGRPAELHRQRHRLPQLPRRLLRADLLPDGVAEGQLPGRVHGRADLLGDGHQGQGPVLRQPDGGDGDRDPAAGRQRVRPRVHGRRAATSASAWTRSRASATRRWRRSSAPARRAARSRRCGTSASASTAARSTSARSRR